MMLYARQPIEETHMGPTPDKSPIESKDDSNEYKFLDHPHAYRF